MLAAVSPTIRWQSGHGADCIRWVPGQDPKDSAGMGMRQ